MPYCARKHQLENSLTYHVLNRSNGRVPIFIDTEDFEYFKDILARYKTRYGFKLYHWVIMGNHYHLLLEIEDPRLISKVMAGINKAYSYYYHKNNATSGYLWQGRFKLQPVQKEDYMVACGRYIEQNPLKAGMVKSPEDYPHSSARHYCSGSKDGITDDDLWYLGLGDNEMERQKAYWEFLKDFDKDDEAHFEQMEKPAGYQAFLDRLVKEKGRFIPRRKGRIRTRI